MGSPVFSNALTALVSFNAEEASLMSLLPVNEAAASTRPVRSLLFAALTAFAIVMPVLTSDGKLTPAKFMPELTRPAMLPLSIALMPPTMFLASEIGIPAKSVKPAACPAPSAPSAAPVQLPWPAEIAAFKPCANGATPGMNEAAARMVCKSPTSLLDAPVVYTMGLPVDMSTRYAVLPSPANVPENALPEARS